jgi:hypothetical protein
MVSLVTYFGERVLGLHRSEITETHQVYFSTTHHEMHSSVSIIRNFRWKIHDFKKSDR